MNVHKEVLFREAESVGIPLAKAEELWARLTTAPEGQQRFDEQQRLDGQQRLARQQKFDVLQVAYYFGGLIVIGAMAYFFSLAWERVGGTGILAMAVTYGCIFGCLGPHLFHSRKFYVAGGLLTTVAVCMAPLAVYGLERALGWWPHLDPGSYPAIQVWTRESWLLIELSGLAAGGVALRFVRFPFLTVPMSVALWYLTMDLTPLLLGRKSLDEAAQLWVSVVVGIAILTIAYRIDRRTKDDYAFWLYLTGLAAAWGGLSLMDSEGPWSRLVYCAINLMLFAVATLLDRRIFAVFGSVGVAGYLSYLVFRLFKDSLFLPMALTVIGVGVIVGTVAYQRNRARIDAYLVSVLPDGFMRLLPAGRE